MIVDIVNQQKLVRIDTAEIERLVLFILKKEKISTDEIAIHFVTTRKMVALHKKFFFDPTITDCITLPIDSPHHTRPYHFLGEIFVCPQSAIDYVKSKSEKRVNEEIFRYVIHGLLHLLGYDDMSEKKRVVMKKRESALLKLFLDEKKGSPSYLHPNRVESRP